MNTHHPLYRYMVGRATVLELVRSRQPLAIPLRELLEDVQTVWDSTMGNAETHVAMLAAAGLIDRVEADGVVSYRVPEWLDDKIVEDGLEACVVETVPRIEAASLELGPGRWVLMLGHEIIAHASSLRALREGAPWPVGAVAWRLASVVGPTTSAAPPDEEPIGESQ